MSVNPLQRETQTNSGNAIGKGKGSGEKERQVGKTGDHIDLISATKNDPIIVDNEVGGFTDNDPLTQDEDMDPSLASLTGAPTASMGDGKKGNNDDPVHGDQRSRHYRRGRRKRR